MIVFLPEHSEAAEAFVENLQGLLMAHERMTQLRNVATSMRLPLTVKTAFWGLDQLAAIRGQLLLIQSQWKQG